MTNDETRLPIALGQLHTLATSSERLPGLTLLRSQTLPGTNYRNISSSVGDKQSMRILPLANAGSYGADWQSLHHGDDAPYQIHLRHREGITVHWTTADARSGFGHMASSTYSNRQAQAGETREVFSSPTLGDERLAIKSTELRAPRSIHFFLLFRRGPILAFIGDLFLESPAIVEIVQDLALQLDDRISMALGLR